MNVHLFHVKSMEGLFGVNRYHRQKPLFHLHGCKLYHELIDALEPFLNKLNHVGIL